MHHREFDLIDAIRTILVFAVAAMIIPAVFKLSLFILKTIYRGTLGTLRTIKILD